MRNILISVVSTWLFCLAPETMAQVTYVGVQDMEGKPLAFSVLGFRSYQLLADSAGSIDLASYDRRIEVGEQVSVSCFAYRDTTFVLTPDQIRAGRLCVRLRPIAHRLADAVVVGQGGAWPQYKSMLDSIGSAFVQGRYKRKYSVRLDSVRLKDFYFDHQEGHYTASYRGKGYPQKVILHAEGKNRDFSAFVYKYLTQCEQLVTFNAVLLLQPHRMRTTRCRYLGEADGLHLFRIVIDGYEQQAFQDTAHYPMFAMVVYLDGRGYLRRLEYVAKSVSPQSASYDMRVEYEHTGQGIVVSAYRFRFFGLPEQGYHGLVRVRAI